MIIESNDSEDDLTRQYNQYLRNHRYFRRLIEMLEAHPYRNDLCALHASMIVRGGNILSIACNSPIPNAFALSYAQHKGWQKHAELNCVAKVRRKIDLTGCIIYNARLTKWGEIEIAKPCEGCTAMLSNYGFKKAIYTTRTQIETIKIKGKMEIYA